MKENKHVTPYIIASAALFLTALFLLLPKKTFSENENRYLQTFPAFSFRDLKEGRLTDDLLSYCSDHFPARDSFMTVKTETELLLGKREVNGIYLGKDGYLIERYREPVNTERIIRQLRNFAGKTPGIWLMLVPTASEVLKEYLPEGAPVPSVTQTEERALIEEGVLSASGGAAVRTVHCEDLLKEGAERGQVFYRTDHHWTTFGAYLGYRAFCREAGIEPVPEEAYRKSVVTEAFRGTVWSKLDDNRFPGDSMELWERRPGENSGGSAPRLAVRYEDTGEESDSLYNLDYLREKDKYSLFLNNLHDLVTVTNPAADSESVLMLLKDSYANCMLPFLTEHFRTIYVFDTRYYKKGPSAFLRDHPEVTDILVLYNMNTLDNDTGIGGIY